MAESAVSGERNLSLPISVEAREAYDLDEAWIREDGRLVVESFPQLRRLAAALGPGEASAGEIEALALLEHIYRLYLERLDAAVLGAAVDDLEERLGSEPLEEMLVRFVERFPPEPVYRGVLGGREYLAGAETDRRRLLVDVICLRLARRHAPGEALAGLLDPGELERLEAWGEAFERLGSFLDARPGLGEGEASAFADLTEVAGGGAGDLEGQLRHLRRRWGSWLPEWLDRRILTALDVVREERAFRGGAPGGPAPVEAPEVGRPSDPRRYSRDRDWMASLVLVAKNARVWMHQLAHRHDRPVEQLDDIPAAALETLADRGITGLWLIGIWERSSASERIKRATGNDRAVASAYAIDRYRIAEDLGGREAKERLEARAEQVGLRLAADMVPNHMGIDSEWVVEHPERFLGLEEPPFPTYSFQGPDLCDDDRARIVLEDHYYDQSDAAVVFEHTDTRSGETRYIYHGNDGTSTPWNDTAQIDFLNARAREAVVETIVDVARRFPVIRFDAAMALAKEQIQRLWYPPPGEGGAIPSRAEHGMSDEAFEEAMPEEFWREVVERIHREAPETLLLAEAFWKMEGYFVRTLGMHRVYNSAFMHMLRDEDNAEYRALIEETLAYDPEILKRYVNFMNNPDEETAIAQFGGGDKYFGVCVMMATLPGLPMFGHGQIEGLDEKYGMDFDRPLLDEAPDERLLARHRRQIAPLLYRREQFAGVERFRFYEPTGPGGEVESNVFAYSNGRDGERSLVVYHNADAETCVRIDESVSYRRGGDVGAESCTRERLAEWLDVPAESGVYLAFRDMLADREYLRRAREVAERGLAVDLDAYEARVFVDFRLVRDGDDGEYARLCERLDGDGVEDLDRALRRQHLEPVRRAARALLEAGRVLELVDGESAGDEAESFEGLERDAREFAEAAEAATGESFEGFSAAAVRGYRAARRLGEMGTHLRPSARRLLDRLGSLEPETPAMAGVVGGWMLARALGSGAEGDVREAAARRFEELEFGARLEEAMGGAGVGSEAAGRVRRLVGLLVPCGGEGAWGRVEAEARSRLERWTGDPEVRRFLGVNEFDGVVWFDVEAMGVWLGGVTRVRALRALIQAKTVADAAAEFAPDAEVLLQIDEAAQTAEGRLDRLVEGGSGAET